MTGSSRAPLSIEQFAGKLAPVLGNEHALLRVREAMRQLDYRGERVFHDQQRGILKWLGEQQGVVAAAARHLLRQFDRELSIAVPRSKSERAKSEPAPLPSRLVRDELVEALSRALGNEKAKQVIDNACRERGIVPEQLTKSSALETLEALSHTPGLVGVTARFAKARLALKLEGD